MRIKRWTALGLVVVLAFTGVQTTDVLADGDLNPNSAQYALLATQFPNLASNDWHLYNTVHPFTFEYCLSNSRFMRTYKYHPLLSRLIIESLCSGRVVTWVWKITEPCWKIESIVPSGPGIP